MKLSDIDLFIGIDQTGAVHRGQPKLLPTAIIYKNKNWNLISNINGKPLFLKSLNASSIQILLKTLNIPNRGRKIFVCVDAALGLPLIYKSNLNPAKLLRSYFDKTKAYNYGFSSAKNYYKSIQICEKNIYRKTELRLNAKSIFQTYPFQANIQTGTFRIWKDLSYMSKKTYSLPQLGENTDKFLLIYEAYPTLAWKILNQSKRYARTNRLEKTISNIQSLDSIKLLPKDHQDAALIALLAFYILDKSIYESISPSIEGDILGSHLL